MEGTAMQGNYLQGIEKDFDLEPSEPIMQGLFRQYERVLVESLVTSFALDLLVNDQHGGDVDTIHNVRQIGQDGKMGYKNVLNQQAYEQRGGYSYDSYHAGKDTNYAKMTREAREEAKKTGKPTPIMDEYTGENVYVLGKSKGAPSDKKASLDHVLTAKTIHEDQGRVLAGIKGEELADARDNLRWTNVSLNSSMGSTKDKDGNPVDIPDYIALHPELPEETKANMMKSYNEAKASYEKKLAQAYYTSPRFAKDIAKAAGNVGVRMGARQVAGFMFAEMWFAVKEEFQNSDQETDFDMKIFLERIGRGLKRGCENAKEKYADAFSRFLNGAAAGALSSITTTLCNIFFTTAKNVVRLIRQVYPSLVEAAKVFFINPECYTFGERMRAVAKILATGASVVTGVVVSEAISKTPITAIPVLSDVVPVFCGAFVSGIMSCTLLYFLDRNPVINKLVKKLDNLHTIETEVSYYRQQAEYFERYAAELMEIDLEVFQRETALYCSAAAKLESAKNENDLNNILKNTFETLNISLPWGEHESLDAFMKDESAHLVFE